MAYSPTMMRFAQQDPMGYVDGLNDYQAIADNPINRVDSSGLSFTPTFDVDTTKFTITMKGDMTAYFTPPGNWTTPGRLAEKARFLTDFVNGVNSYFSNSPFILRPKNATYKTSWGYEFGWPWWSAENKGFYNKYDCAPTFKPKLAIAMTENTDGKNATFNVFYDGAYPRDTNNINSFDTGLNLTLGTKYYQIIAAHEFGHLIGLRHPGVEAGLPYWTYPKRENDPRMYEADASALMGYGIEYRQHYFKLWKKELDRLYPGADYQIVQQPGTSLDGPTPLK